MTAAVIGIQAHKEPGKFGVWATAHDFAPWWIVEAVDDAGAAPLLLRDPSDAALARCDALIGDSVPSHLLKSRATSPRAHLVLASAGASAAGEQESISVARGSRVHALLGQDAIARFVPATVAQPSDEWSPVAWRGDGQAAAWERDDQWAVMLGWIPQPINDESAIQRFVSSGVPKRRNLR